MRLLKIITRNAPTGPVLRILGDLDYATAGRLREQLTELSLRPGQRLVLDLAEMGFCDSSGITALIVARNHAQAAQADIALASVPDRTLRVLRIAGLDQIFAIVPDTAAATQPWPQESVTRVPTAEGGAVG
ncbi:STAS domain-containing protein [Streptomyces sp. NPDC008313]|uniref:STAS domain-containing protein n=1 Tax=Streptomyces sp. NPDC008313 TaxID=3364826 RepID=UPI0036DFF648